MKTMEKIRPDSVELIKANQIINQFIKSCSHDLKGPLTSIEGLVNISRHYSDPKEIKQCLDLIQNCAGSMKDIVNQLEMHIINLHRTTIWDEVIAESLVNSVVSEYQNAVESNRIELNTRITQPIKWVTDKHFNFLILKNLIANAIAFSDSNKTVKKIDINLSVEEANVVMEVSDNGLGIPDQEKKNLFMPFHRGSTQSTGRGLGLFLVSSIIKKLKGSILVESFESIGTSFKLIIPNNIQS